MDLSARVVAERLQTEMGPAGRGREPPGRRRHSGGDLVLLGRDDNHTFLFSFGGIVTFNHLLHEKLPYDPTELLPIAPVIDNFLGVSVTAQLKVNTLAELVQAAKAQPGKLN